MTCRGHLELGIRPGGRNTILGATNLIFVARGETKWKK